MIQWKYQVRKQNWLVCELGACNNSTSFDFKICLRARKVSGPIEKRNPAWRRCFELITGSRESIPALMPCLLLSFHRQASLHSFLSVKHFNSFIHRIKSCLWSQVFKRLCHYQQLMCKEYPKYMILPYFKLMTNFVLLSVRTYGIQKWTTNIWGLITEILLLLIDKQSYNQTELISWGLFYVQYFYYAFGCGDLSHVIVFF